MNARFVKPIDTDILDEAAAQHTLFVTLEENVASGAYGEKVRAYLGGMDNAPRLLTINIPDEYVEHGNVEILKKEIGIDSETIRNKILEIVQK